MTQRIDILNALFGGPGRTAVLRLLASRSAPLTGRQVAGLTGLSQPGAARALEHLANLGVVSRRAAGRAILHELERENLLVQSIVLPSLAAEQSLTDDLLKALAETFGPVSVSATLFGSIVAGEAGPGSDIDVLVVTEDDQQSALALEAYDAAGLQFFRRYGMPLSVIVTARGQLPPTPSAFWIEARDTGVTVCGAPLKELL
jgi:hypothetical protein